MEENIKNPPYRSRVPLIFLVVGIVLVASNLRAPITALGPLMGSIVADTHLSSSLAGMLTTLPLLAFAAFSLLFLIAASLLQLFAGLGAGRNVKVSENDSQWQPDSHIRRTGTTL